MAFLDAPFKQGRRAALLSGAAAGLAAAFNTPLSAITFVMEDIVTRPISTLANFSPVFASSTNHQELKRLCAGHPYQQFPLVIDGRLVGLLNRAALLEGQTPGQAQRPAETVNPDATIREAVSRMIDKSMSLLVVISPTDETPIGIVTLHDIVRLQNQLADAM
jgi:predicted transcriptional regulator